MSIVFWISLLWVFYAYIGYLVVLSILVKIKKEDFSIDEEFLPPVSLIIAAYNEEDAIGEKIRQSLSLDYPKNKLQIIIASDASTDKTDELVKDFAREGVILVRQTERRGKTSAQNLAVANANGEILVFSDATTIFDKCALRKLIRHFVDYRVGCVGGEERFIESDKEISAEAGFFWKYETLIREKESEFNTMIGVSGCIFAMRKELYEPLEDGLIEDFTLPLNVAEKGFNTIYEKDAIAYERAVSDTQTELIRKTRIVSGGINVVWKKRALLNPLKYSKLSFQIFSHKICRWLAPIFMITFFISNLFLMQLGILYLILIMLQTIFYLMALVGYFAKSDHKISKVPRLIYHFCIVNSAAILGMAQFLHGEKKTVWQPVR